MAARVSRMAAGTSRQASESSQPPAQPAQPADDLEEEEEEEEQPDVLLPDEAVWQHDKIYVEIQYKQTVRTYYIYIYSIYVFLYQCEMMDT
jgi:hypothetical protein